MTDPLATPVRHRAEISRTADAEVLTLGGDIDDDVQLVPLAAKLGRRVIIDLDGVTFINSVGVREWITLLDALATRNTDVTLRKVSEPMVRQMAMVTEASGATTIESFHAPYVCTACSEETSLVLPVAPHRAALVAHQPPRQPCPRCGGEMEFDEFPNRYLSFLS